MSANVKQVEETGRRLTHTLGEGFYRALRVKAAQEGLTMKAALESAITLFAGTAGPVLIPATCPVCSAALQCSTSGRVYIGGPGGKLGNLSDETIALAEAIETLKTRNPMMAEAVENLIRSVK